MSKVKVFLMVLQLLLLQNIFAIHGEPHYKRGLSLYEKGVYGAAEMEFTKAREVLSRSSDFGMQFMDCERMMALSAAAAGKSYGLVLLRDFLDKYPSSLYADQMRFAIAESHYNTGNYAQAVDALFTIDISGASQGQRDEYNFKLGHSLFQSNDSQGARKYFDRVSPSSIYYSHAKYFEGYIDYRDNDFDQAKQQFASIRSNPVYAKVIPFYILQIEFMQGNYQYVVDHADNLIETSTGKRTVELIRISAESWYRLGEYDRALGYLELYRNSGGTMGRDEFYIEGYCSYMRGYYKRSIAAFVNTTTGEDALARNACYHLADCYLNIGDQRSAMQAFSIAAGGPMGEVIREDALFNYGKLQYELGGGVFNEAINVLNRYIKDYPKSPRVDQVREYLLAAYYNSHNYDAAYQAIKQIPNPDNNVKTALQKITYFRALEYFDAQDYASADRLLAVAANHRYNAKYTALTYYWQAEILSRNHEYAKATVLYKSYISLAPSSEPERMMAHYNLGYCYFNLKQWDEASDWFVRFLSGYKGGKDYIADTYNRMGDIKYSRRAFWVAIEEYEKAIKQSTSQQYYAAFRRAVLLGMVDRVPRKIESLQTIISSAKGDYVDEAVYELGRTYMAQEQFADAAKIMTRYVTDYPNGTYRVDVFSSLGLIYQNLNQPNKALESYKQVVAVAPASTQAKDAMLGIQNIYVENNDVDSYFTYASKAGVETDISTIKRDSLSFASAEHIYLVNSDMKRSVVALEGYLKNYPNGTSRHAALYYLGDCALRMKDRAKAASAYSSLSEMYYNEYTLRALDKLAVIYGDDGDFKKAAQTYYKLSEAAAVPSVIDGALAGYVRSAVKVKDNEFILKATDAVLGSEYALEQTLREASFAKANVLYEQKKSDQAMAIYSKLASEVQSREGAQSAYMVIEQASAKGDNKRTKDMVFALSDKNSPHTYWVGKSFLILGDVYARQGDAFQARATYQSIVDGYLPANDGIIDTALQRIKELK